MIATERVGPFPARVRDVGVVKDLATHDLDLVRWFGGAPLERVAAQTQHRMGRAHEDLVEEGLATVLAAEAVLEAASGETVRL